MLQVHLGLQECPQACGGRRVIYPYLLTLMAWNSLFGLGWLASKLQCSLVSASPGLGSQHRQPCWMFVLGSGGGTQVLVLYTAKCVAIPITPAPHLVFLSEPQEWASLHRLVTDRAPARSSEPSLSTNAARCP